MLRTCLLFILIFSFLSINSFGRETISGYVRDAASGEALIAANVIVLELGTGTATNIHGYYALSLDPGVYTLIFSYVGYETLTRTEDLIKEYLGMIPNEFSQNHDIDFLNQLTQYDVKLRDELYAKASGLKETAMSLRDEVLREHDAEVIEITVLKEGLRRIWGEPHYASAHIVDSMMYPATMGKIAKEVANNYFRGEAIKSAIMNFYSHVDDIWLDNFDCIKIRELKVVY